MHELLRHKVRFGELSFGPFAHYATVFDWLIVATEELSYELGYTVEEIVEGGGVPYAPVALEVTLDTYPRYEDTVVLTAEPAAIGENAVQLEYRLARAADDETLGRARLVQVTITPEHSAEPIADEVRERLAALGDSSLEPAVIDPRRPTGDGRAMERRLTFRTPHIEAAGLGYFEDYARELSICLEDFLTANGPSLGELTGPTYPFIPITWALTLEESIRFEDEIGIDGRVRDVEDDAVTIAFELTRDDEVCIRAEVTYGCLDGDGDRVPFPPAALAAVSS